MGNSLTIINSKQKEELYKDLEGKWLIVLTPKSWTQD